MLAGQAAERRAVQDAESEADEPGQNRATPAPVRRQVDAGPLRYDDTGDGAPTLRGSVPIRYRSPEEIARLTGQPWPPSPADA